MVAALAALNARTWAFHGLGTRYPRTKPTDPLLRVVPSNTIAHTSTLSHFHTSMQVVRGVMRYAKPTESDYLLRVVPNLLRITNSMAANIDGACGFVYGWEGSCSCRGKPQATCFTGLFH
jgi:hypothetical protein